MYTAVFDRKTLHVPWVGTLLGLFCKRTLYKRRYSAKETYTFKTHHGPWVGALWVFLSCSKINSLARCVLQNSSALRIQVPTQNSSATDLKCLPTQALHISNACVLMYYTSQVPACLENSSTCVLHNSTVVEALSSELDSLPVVLHLTSTTELKCVLQRHLSSVVLKCLQNSRTRRHLSTTELELALEFCSTQVPLRTQLKCLELCSTRVCLNCLELCSTWRHLSTTELKCQLKALELCSTRVL